MINFIVVEDNEKISQTIQNVITKTMINSQYDYKINAFDDYDKKFLNFIKQPLPNKVYFFDIETRSASGIDIARLIRKNDIDSIIIFATAHEELGGVVAKDQLMILTFICKFDNFEEKIKEATIKSLQVLGKKRLIRFNDNGATYTIPLNDIIYVTRDSVERKLLIKTDYTTYKISKSLTEIKDLAAGTLIQTHRACLVNESRTRKIDKKNNTILFDNGEVIDLLSDSFKKVLV